MRVVADLDVEAHIFAPSLTYGVTPDFDVNLTVPLVRTALDVWAGFVTEPEVVTTAVAAITGQPARPFRDWAVEHADDFR